LLQILENKEICRGWDVGIREIRIGRSAKNRTIFAKRHGVNGFGASRFCGFFRLFATVFGFSQRDVTRNVTRREVPPKTSRQTAMGEFSVGKRDGVCEGESPAGATRINAVGAHT
jgi:hypothetical protein